MILSSLLLLGSCWHRTPTLPDSAELREVQVQWGDTLWSIATRYDVPGGYPALARLNGIRDPDYIALGQRLRVPSADSSLPLWPVASPMEAALRACRVEALPPARPGSVAGGATGVIELGGGVQIVASRTVDRGQLAGLANGRVVWARAPELEPAPWADDPGAPAAAPPADLLGFRVQLDGDADLESVAGWRLETNELGMSRWMVAVVDFPERDRASVFEVANFGAGSFVTTTGGACGLLASEWTLGHEPGEGAEGWNLLARRMDLHDGGWGLAAEAGLLSRRLYASFVPGAVPVGRLTSGNVAADLLPAATRHRASEPLVAHPRVREERRDVVGSEASPEGLVLSAGWRTPVLVGGPGEGPLRLGDGRSGLLYPAGWVPAHPERLGGAPARFTSYLPSWFGEPVSILWLLG